MRHLIIAFLMASSAALVHTATAGPVGPPRPLPEDFPLEDIAAQMTQLDINNYVNSSAGAFVLQRDKLIAAFKGRHVGSLFNVPVVSNAPRPIPNIDEWRAMTEELHTISASHGSKIPVLFGLDSVHGANYIYNATLFPQQIGLAASFNTSVAFEAGRITAQETRYAGVPWIFAPILDIAVQPAWARVFETFGEDTHLASEMGFKIVTGIQSPPAAGMNASQWPHQAAACLKHFLGYSNPRNGRDRTSSDIPMNHLLQYYAPPFTRAINAGAMSVMENYVDVNGRPTAVSDVLLNFLLRDMFGFKGMLVTDYNEIYNLADFHFTSRNHTEAILDAFNTTSIDMGMVGLAEPYPNMAKTIAKHNSDGRIKLNRLRESGARVMELKRKLGLLDGSPVPYKNTTCMFACAESREAALDATRQSLTLLRNEPMASGPNAGRPLLPLSNALTRIAVVGKACDSLALMSGGWTIRWQGGGDDDSGFAYGTTIRRAIEKRYPKATVTYHEGCDVAEGSQCDEAKAAASIAAAANAEVVIACAGEDQYAEKPGDIEDMTLPGGQIGWLKQIHAANPNVVMLLVQGRPRVLKELATLIPSILYTFLPGPAGGEAIADVLTGAFNPSGRLPITYPSSVSNAPVQYNRRMSANTKGDYAPQWTFGHGLSYTTYDLHDLACAWYQPLGWQCTVEVNNSGSVAGSFTAIFYARQHWRPIAPEAQRVIGFGKIFLLPGEAKSVSVMVPLTRVSFHDEFNCEQGFASPISITVANGAGSAIGTAIEGVDFRQTSCTNWVALWQSKTGFNYIVPTAPPGPGPNSGELTEAYFISSVVCFGAGIVGTVILITWLRRRGNQKAGALLEPSGI